MAAGGVVQRSRSRVVQWVQARGEDAQGRKRHERFQGRLRRWPCPGLPSRCLCLAAGSCFRDPCWCQSQLGAGLLSPHHLLLLTLFFLASLFGSSGIAQDGPCSPGQWGSPTGLLSTVSEQGCPGESRGIAAGAAVLRPETPASASQWRDLEGSSQAGCGTGESLGGAASSPPWLILPRPPASASPSMVPPAADAGVVHEGLSVWAFCCSSRFAAWWRLGMGKMLLVPEK